MQLHIPGVGCLHFTPGHATAHPWRGLSALHPAYVFQPPSGLAVGGWAEPVEGKENFARDGGHGKWEAEGRGRASAVTSGGPVQRTTRSSSQPPRHCPASCVTQAARHKQSVWSKLRTIVRVQKRVVQITELLRAVVKCQV